MPKRLRLIMLLTMLTLALTVSADSLGFTKEKPLRFSLDDNYPPMQFVDEKGRPRGRDVVFTDILMERLGIPFDYVPNSWEKVADDVMNGRSDLAMMVFSPYRKDSINYSQAVFRLYYQIVFRKSNPIHNGLREISGKTIALMKSRPIIDTLSRAGANHVLVQDLPTALEELADGKYDGVICFRYQAKYLIDRYGLHTLQCSDLTLMPREYCYVSHNKALIDAIDRELEMMEEEGVTEEVYDYIMNSFDRLIIPAWVWYLLAGLLLVSLLVIIFIQRRSRKRILEEMQRAQQSEQLKDVFLSNLSHALRTPLNAIIGFTDLLMTVPRGEMPEEEEKNLLRLVNQNGQQLLHMISQLLSLSDIAGKQQLFERRETDIQAEMHKMADDARRHLHGGVQLEVVDPIGGMYAMLDDKLLRLVTASLLENAVQHTREGKVTLFYCAKNGGLYAEVRDTGYGLPENLRGNIFALLSDKNTYLGENTPGLGLSICKAVLDKGNGQIGVRDNDVDGQGTIFWYWAPVEILKNKKTEKKRDS